MNCRLHGYNPHMTTGRTLMRNLLLGLLFCIPLAATAAPMSNDDVVRMVRGGLGDPTVIQAIDAAEAGFDTSPDGLVRLKSGGVSDAVIQRIIARKGAAPVAAYAPPANICRECGTITGIREVNKPGQASGLGAVAGAVAGGVLGRNLGGGNHRTSGAILGAVGGGVAGHQIEKVATSGKSFEIDVRLDDGSYKVFHQDSHPSWNPGTRVRMVNGALAPL